MWWILILTIVSASGESVSVATIEDFQDERLCKIAGDKFLFENNRMGRVTYVCARRT